jgi:outer membrane receptor protein involved in Fe transport
LGNYNYNQVIDNPEFYKQDFVASFNTPKHKYNIGFNALRIKKNFGFSMNLRWVDQILFKEYNKEGIINSYYNVDMMVSYNLPKYKTMLKIGGSNVTNERYIQSLGAPTVGAVYYFSILFDELLK